MAKATNSPQPEDKEIVAAEATPTETAQTPLVKPEMDPTKSHKERIVLFVQSRKTTDFVRIDGFLKALFATRQNEKPGWSNQGNMKTLRQDLRDLKAERKLVFSNENFELLGSHYWSSGDLERKTKYHDVTTIIIEARL